MEKSKKTNCAKSLGTLKREVRKKTDSNGMERGQGMTSRKGKLERMGW